VVSALAQQPLPPLSHRLRFFVSPRGRRGTLLTQDPKCVAGVALRDIEHFTFQSHAALVAEKCRHSRTVLSFSVGGCQGTALHCSRASCGASKRVAGVAHRDMQLILQFFTARQSMLQNGNHSRTFFVLLLRVRDRRIISSKSDLVLARQNRSTGSPR